MGCSRQWGVARNLPRANATNHVQVVVVEESGWLFVNGKYVAELDLAEAATKGSISVYLSADQGISRTRFSNFTVRSLSRAYGPRNGSIDHVRDGGFINEHRSHISIRDGIAEARFYTPYASSLGGWSYGFLVRNGREGWFHAIVVEEDQRWQHHLRLGGADSTEVVADSHTSLISTAVSSSNHIRLIMLGEEGWFFVNGNYVEKLDLSGLTTTGTVAAITNYFTDHGIVGYSTLFEDFTVWSAD